MIRSSVPSLFTPGREDESLVPSVVMVEASDNQPSKGLYAGRLRDLDESRLTDQGFAEALDVTTGKPVLVGIEKKSVNPTLAPLSSIEHAHLAEVVALVDHADSWLVLTHAPKGTTLRARLADIGRKHAVDAVRTTLRIADVLSHLHDAGITHGRVNPDNIRLALDIGVEPALVYGARSEPEYLRPERGSSDTTVDARDDAWATTALLYFMLVGVPPPASGLNSLSSVEGLGIDDPLLCEVLVHGLSAHENKRAKDLSSLKRELARWFIAHAADEPIPASIASHKPPPLPASVMPKITHSGVPVVGGISAIPRNQPLSLEETRRGWLRSLPLAIGAAVVGIGLVWGVARVSRSNTTVLRITDPGSSTAAVIPSGPIDLAEVPVTGEGEGQEQAARDPTASCAKGYLREATLTKTAQLDSICRESELPRLLGVLRSAFTSVTGANGPVPPGSSRFDPLGWYALPLLSGLRKACCTDPPALQLPDLGDKCPDFASSLDELARTASTTQQFDAVIGRYTLAAKCAAETGKASGISPAPPGLPSERAFRDLFVAPPAP